MYSLGLILILQYFLKEIYGINDPVTGKDKQALRFGFHQTHDCHEFDKAFKCIRKCLDRGFDVAHANENCACTCYSKKEKEKYRHLALLGKTQTVPTTKIPWWAQGGAGDEMSLVDNHKLNQDKLSLQPGDINIPETTFAAETEIVNVTHESDVTHEPEEGEGTAAEGEEAPPEGEAAAAEGGEAPAEGEAAPAEGEEAPVEAEVAPAEAEEAPAEAEEAPAEEK